MRRNKRRIMDGRARSEFLFRCWREKAEREMRVPEIAAPRPLWMRWLAVIGFPSGRRRAHGAAVARIALVVNRRCVRRLICSRRTVRHLSSC